MVDTLVSGASASRHVGSSPILGTKKRAVEKLLFFLCPLGNHINKPSKPPFVKGGYKSFETSLICKYLHSETALFLCPLGNHINKPSKPPFKFLFVASARLYKFYLHRSRLNRNVDKGGYKSFETSLICKFLLTPFFFVPYGTDINISPVSYLSSFSLFKKQKILRHHTEFEQQELR